MTRLASRSEDFGLAAPVYGREVSGQAPRGSWYGFPQLLFLASAAGTALWCHSMSTEPGMPMPGGWNMSMTWMRMPGKSWAGAVVSFATMWLLMMVAMMLPSLTPTLRRYQEAMVRAGASRPGRPTMLAGLGYFFVWTIFGLAVFPLGLAVAALEMTHPPLARAVPLGAGVTVLLAGALQFTPWKAHHLARCRTAPAGGCAESLGAAAAWRLGLHFGVHCGLSCANLTAVLLALGVMDLRAMAAVTIAITFERIAPDGPRAARTVGVLAVATGLVLIARAAELG